MNNTIKKILAYKIAFLSLIVGLVSSTAFAEQKKIVPLTSKSATTKSITLPQKSGVVSKEVRKRGVEEEGDKSPLQQRTVGKSTARAIPYIVNTGFTLDTSDPNETLVTITIQNRGSRNLEAGTELSAVGFTSGTDNWPAHRQVLAPVILPAIPARGNIEATISLPGSIPSPGTFGNLHFLDINLHLNGNQRLVDTTFPRARMVATLLLEEWSNPMHSYCFSQWTDHDGDNLCLPAECYEGDFIIPEHVIRECRDEATVQRALDIQASLQR